ASMAVLGLPRRVFHPSAHQQGHQIPHQSLIGANRRSSCEIPTTPHAHTPTARVLEDLDLDLSAFARTIQQHRAWLLCVHAAFPDIRTTANNSRPSARTHGNFTLRAARLYFSSSMIGSNSATNPSARPAGRRGPRLTAPRTCEAIRATDGLAPSQA